MITVAGLSPSLDITYVVDALVLGAIHRPTEVVRCAGGKPLNLARAAAALGSSVGVVAVLGGVIGSDLAVRLRQAGIEVTVVEAAAETRTCVSISAADTGELTEVYEYAAPLSAGVWERLIASLDQVLAHRPGWLAISGSPPRELQPTALAELLALAHDRGVQVAVDTHGPALAPLVAASPELVKINRFEAAELLGASIEVPAETMARWVAEQTGGAVVVTDGVAGAVGVAGEQAVRLPPVSDIGPYPVGSGDSFLAGLLIGLEAGADLGAALELAQATGVANAAVPGPGLLAPAFLAARGR